MCLQKMMCCSALEEIIDKVAKDCQQPPEAGQNQKPSKQKPSKKESPATTNWADLIVPPDQITESLYKSFLYIFYQGNVVLGPKLSLMFRGLGSKELLNNLDEFSNEGYLITITGNKVATALRVGVDDADTFKAFVHSMVIYRCLSNHSQHNISNQELVQRYVSLFVKKKFNEHRNHFSSLVDCRSHVQITNLFGEEGREESPNLLSLAAMAKRGWDVESRLNLGFRSTRLQWYGSKSE
jgi:hypothetical protein